MMKWTMMAWLVLVVGVVGCDDSSDGGGDDAGVSGGEDAGEAKAWAELDRAGRQMFMAQQILPAMQPVFAGFDDRFATDFSCGTCHGSDLMSFATPSDIPALDGEELSSFTFAGEGKQEIANLMASQVVPQMAQLLGQEPFNPETNTGTFGCANCHAIE